jgi:hypothetical protein
MTYRASSVSSYVLFPKTLNLFGLCILMTYSNIYMCVCVCVCVWQWQTTPMNLPRMQRARAIPVAWLGSGSCWNRPKGWILINQCIFMYTYTHIYVNIWLICVNTIQVTFSMLSVYRYRYKFHTKLLIAHSMFVWSAVISVAFAVDNSWEKNP